jgi:ribosomal RNA-processing protein 9
MEDRFRSKRRKVARSRHFVDEEIEDTEGVDFGDEPEDNNQENKEEEEIEETADEKRIRLAKEYLSRVEKSVGADEVDAKVIDKEIIASRLKQDAVK